MDYEDYKKSKNLSSSNQPEKLSDETDNGEDCTLVEEGTDLKFQDSLYTTIMNSRNSKYHIYASIVYILSLISYEFLVIQLVLMLRIVLTITKAELITLTAMVFIGVSCGWILKNIFIEDFYLRRNIFLSAIFCLIILIYIISTKSTYILFFFYPVISLSVGVILFNSQHLYEEFYISDSNQQAILKGKREIPSNISGKLLINAITMFSSLLAFLSVAIFSQDLTRVLWNLELIVFGFIILLTGIFIYIASESPIHMYINQKYNVGPIFDLLELIYEKKLTEEQKDKILKEFQSMFEKKDTFSYMSLLKDNIRKESSVFLVIIFFSTYVSTSILISVPIYILEHTNINGAARSHDFFIRNLIFFSIGAIGGMVSIICLRFLSISRKILLTSSFGIIFVLIILMLVFNQKLYIFAGFVLLLTNSITFILMKYATENYEEGLNIKAERGFQLASYFSSTITVIMFETFFHGISPIAGYITTLWMTISGGVVCLLLNR